jgi:uncharacterized protein
MPKQLLTRTMFAASGLEVRKASDGKQTLVGYAVRWDQLSEPICGMFREKVSAGAFINSLMENNIRALWNHNPDLVLGATKSGTMRCKEDKNGLAFEIDLPDTQAGRDAAVTVSRGDVDGMSFGFNVRKQEWDETDPKNIIRTLTDVDLREISPTPFPAYSQTSVGMRSMADDFSEFAEARKIQADKMQAELSVNAFRIRKMKIHLLERG